ncbi:MAG: hypothetical protein KJP21_01160 [Bacteroidia bacterium]|nr:hypothetical protein [Bacteroidia bacterium]NNJ55845.1 hypothetical protein [Bacteroidia bacterium]
MKKTKIFMTALALGISSFAFAQVNLNFGLGYHQGAFGNEMGYTAETDASGVTTETATNLSFGGGIPITIGVGLGITDNITLDANFEYWLGSEKTVLDQSSPLGSGTAVTKSNQIRFAPSLLFHNGDNGLYGRVGLVLPVGGKTTVEIVQEGGGFKSTENQESAGAFSVGGVAGVGYKHGISDNLQIFGELQAVALTIKSKSSTITDYEDNLGGTLDSQYPTVQDKETEYVDEVKSTDNSDTSKPWMETASKSAYSSLGLNVGIRWIFGG